MRRILKLHRYVVNHDRVYLVDGANCSSRVMLKVEQSRGCCNFWFAFAQSEPQMVAPTR